VQRGDVRDERQGEQDRREAGHGADHHAVAAPRRPVEHRGGGARARSLRALLTVKKGAGGGERCSRDAL
jgi:hypothetical protein